MASLGHVAVGMAAGRAWAGKSEEAGRTMVLLAALSLAPDLDVIGMHFGVPYPAPWGHRGATHSLAMAAALGVAVALVVRRRYPMRTFAPVAVAVVASHGLLDAMTNGGLGIALLWPAETTRYFLPWRPIPVAPIGGGMVSVWGLAVLLWEAAVFAPAWLWAIWPRASREE